MSLVRVVRTQDLPVRGSHPVAAVNAVYEKESVYLSKLISRPLTAVLGHVKPVFLPIVMSVNALEAVE